MAHEQQHTYGTPPWQQRVIAAREKARSMPGKAVLIGLTRKPEWREPLRMYALYCKSCDAYTETNAAGYGRITCRRCLERRASDGAHEMTVARIMTPRRFRDKYAFPAIVALIVLVAFSYATYLMEAKGLPLLH